jgi:hypothetical protein
LYPTVSFVGASRGVPLSVGFEKFLSPNHITPEPDGGNGKFF